MKRLALSVAAVLALTSVASAQPEDDKSKQPVKVKVLNITDGDDITADVPTGDLIPVSVRDTAKSSSLIRIRRDFIDLILKAAEDLT